MAVRRHNSKPVIQRVMRSLTRTVDNEGCVLVNRGTLARGTSAVATLSSLHGERQRSGSLLLVFETVIVAALRNNTDRFVQLDLSVNTYTVAVAELQCNCG